MISPLRVGPNVTMAELVNAYNDLANQLEDENRTRIMKDERGNERIIFGKTPKGEWLIAISAQGIDVVKALEG